MAYSRYQRHGQKRKASRCAKYRPCIALSSEASLTAKTLRTVDEDILLLLYQVFRAGGAPLAHLKSDYRRRHGDKAADYLEEAWYEWMSGSTRVSVQTMERLVDLLPKVISHQERYRLLKKIYETSRERTRTSHYVSFTIGRNEREAEEKLRQHARELIAKPKNHQLPEGIQIRMRWACNEEAGLARSLMAAIEEEVSVGIARAAKLEVARLIDLLRTSANVEGNHLIEFPYGNVVVFVRQKTLLEKVSDVFR